MGKKKKKKLSDDFNLYEKKSKKQMLNSMFALKKEIIEVACT